MKKILIVGGVAGGATAAARLRRLDETSEIIMFERGEYISFANCGLPYYIGEVIQNRDALLVQTVPGMSQRFNIDIRNFSEVISIDPENKTVTVKKVQTGEEYTESYDELILSPGANPIKPPIPGLDQAENVFTLRNIPDTDAIKAYVDERKPNEAVVIGGGFIGVEMAENLVERGVKVHLIEMLDQVMAPFDFEMAQILHGHMEDNGVDLILGDGVDSFKNNGKTIVLKSGKEVNTDITILSIGIKPENELAKSAGLELGPRGHIIVNENLETSKKHIHAVGDAIQTKDLIYQEPASIALASPANRQARIVADRINGIDSKYKGVLGTSVAKVFDMTASSTGNNEKKLKQMGKENYQTVHLHPLSNAGYYPTAMPMDLKLIFEIPSGKILGAQAVGFNGVEKRIDVISTAISGNLTVRDLQDVELAYAPPFSSAKDPVNMAGYAATNILDGLVKKVDVMDIDKLVEEGAYLLDTRTTEEFSLGYIKGAINVPLDELRDRLSELPKDKTIYVNCQVGLRGYLATRILSENGFDAVNVDGGYNLYANYKRELKKDTSSLQGVGLACTDNSDAMPKKKVIKDSNIIKIDARGLQCPGPIAKIFTAMNEAKQGDVVEVLASDPGFGKDIANWCLKMDYKLMELEKDGKNTRALIEKTTYKQKGNVNISCSVSSKPKDKNGATMVVFSGDLDKAIASFIIATGAATMGKEVTMFFTFWGLNILRDPKINVEKEGMEKMFGKMMPKGVDELKISKMNMGGMGTKMIRDIMEKKNVDSLQLLISRAQELGVKFVACSMSMDIMGIREEELIDGVEIAGVASYLSDAEDGNLNLFI
ncbi:CoA-disulfide reductase [Peptostreptococcus equinus]|uniref:CoA-disulfide reductase n=1 Tax=Peptostreptococcus equinus TaxID=3003601 RepID=A0ABY7JRI6_9FIRM|nr:CoA-disulfide reductase [Peptostreptococcus sp. CBA3647]WAW15106.1 CoA-disulfide reductase [Peptostreptococcus sp. CBA3647]